MNTKHSPKTSPSQDRFRTSGRGKGIRPLITTAAIAMTMLGCGGGQDAKTTGDATAPTRERAVANVTFKIPAEMLKKLPATFDEDMTKHGLVHTGDTLTHTVPLALQELTIDGAKVTTDRDGYFTPPTKTRAITTVAIDAPLDKQPLKALPASDGVKTWAYDTTYDQVYGDCCGTTASAHDSPPTRDPHSDARCLDYNGWYSDRVNYPITNWKAFRNFLGSDCHWALPFCINDHKYPGGCMARHGGCSKFIWHSQDPHWHNLY